MNKFSHQNELFSELNHRSKFCFWIFVQTWIHSQDIQKGLRCCVLNMSFRYLAHWIRSEIPIVNHVGRDNANLLVMAFPAIVFSAIVAIQWSSISCPCCKHTVNKWQKFKHLWKKKTNWRKESHMRCNSFD